MAHALLHEPDVLIMDEPTAGLDPNQIVEVRKTLLRIAQEKTILLSTHILQEVEAMAKRVIMINEGRLVYDGAAQKLVEQARLDGSRRFAYADSAAHQTGRTDLTKRRQTTFGFLRVGSCLTRHDHIDFLSRIWLNFIEMLKLVAIDAIFVVILALVLTPLAQYKQAAFAVLKRNFVGYFANPTGYVFLVPVRVSDVGRGVLAARVLHCQPGEPRSAQ